MTADQLESLRAFLGDLGYCGQKAEELKNGFLTWLNDNQLYVAPQ